MSNSSVCDPSVDLLRTPCNYHQVALAEITIPPSRHRLEPEKVADLARSIKELGQLQPIGLTADYRLIYGGRRKAACELLGHDSIDAIILDLDDLHAELAKSMRMSSIEPSPSWTRPGHWLAARQSTWHYILTQNRSTKRAGQDVAKKRATICRPFLSPRMRLRKLDGRPGLSNVKSRLGRNLIPRPRKCCEEAGTRTISPR